jgi:hypothetical protein
MYETLGSQRSPLDQLTKKKKKKKKKKKRSGRRFLLYCLLIGLGFAGYRNYQRNLAAEEAVPRPFKTHSAAELDQLISAYRGDLDSMVARYKKVSGHDIKIQDKGFGGDQIKEFERVQGLSQSVRQLGYEISEREATLRELEHERSLREEQGAAIKQFLRRLFTVAL